ncbi:DNA-binding transcriptional repressor PuuR [compost metagenome]
MRFQRDVLRRLRESKKMSRRELGEAATLTAQAIWKLESGRTSSPSIPTVNSLALALGVSTSIFFDETTNPSKQQSSEDPPAA